MPQPALPGVRRTVPGELTDVCAIHRSGSPGPRPAVGERRAQPRSPAWAAATVRPAGQYAGWGAFAALVDVSAGGGQFWMMTPQEVGCDLAVELQPAGGAPLRLAAVVRWVGPAPKPGWSAAGCAWLRPLDDEQLRQLAQAARPAA